MPQKHLEMQSEKQTTFYSLLEKNLTKPSLSCTIHNSKTSASCGQTDKKYNLFNVPCRFDFYET